MARRTALAAIALVATLGGCGTIADPDGPVTDHTVGGATASESEASGNASDSESDPAGAAGPPLSSVADAARALDAELEGDVAAVVVDLSTGEWAGHQGSTVFTSASLYKLYVAATALAAVDDGELSLDDAVGGGCGTLGYALELAIVVSDNACAIQLGTFLGWDRVEGYVDAQGFVGTSFHTVQQGAGWGTTGQETTAADTADLLARLAQGELLSPSSTDVLRGLLEEQYFDSALSLELDDPSATFAHKLGTLQEVSHDAGILTTDEGSYVVAVLTGNWPGWAETAAEPALAGVGQALVDYALPGRSDTAPATADGNTSR